MSDRILKATQLRRNRPLAFTMTPRNESSGASSAKFSKQRLPASPASDAAERGEGDDRNRRYQRPLLKRREQLHAGGAEPGRIRPRPRITRGDPRRKTPAHRFMGAIPSSRRGSSGTIRCSQHDMICDHAEFVVVARHLHARRPSSSAIAVAHFNNDIWPRSRSGVGGTTIRVSSTGKMATRARGARPRRSISSPPARETPVICPARSYRRRTASACLDRLEPRAATQPLLRFIYVLLRSRCRPRHIRSSPATDAEIWVRRSSSDEDGGAVLFRGPEPAFFLGPRWRIRRSWLYVGLLCVDSVNFVTAAMWPVPDREQVDSLHGRRRHQWR